MKKSLNISEHIAMLQEIEEGSVILMNIAERYISADEKRKIKGRKASREYREIIEPELRDLVRLSVDVYLAFEKLGDVERANKAKEIGVRTIRYMTSNLGLTRKEILYYASTKELLEYKVTGDPSGIDRCCEEHHRLREDGAEFLAFRNRKVNNSRRIESLRQILL